jgi:hypothetical protein
MSKSQNVTLSLLFLISLLIFSCGGFTTEEIEAESKGTVIESISKSYDISSSNIKVEDYTLVQKSDNVYTGILKTEYQDMTQTFDIEVVWDHSTDEYTVEWELKEEKEKSITPNVENNEQSQNQVIDELDPDDNFYIIAVSIASSDIEAMDKVKSLESQGYNSDFLWIPDYKSLSGAKYFSVYIGPFRSESECALAIEDYRKINPTAYGLLVSNESSKRVEIRGPVANSGSNSSSSSSGNNSNSTSAKVTSYEAEAFMQDRCKTINQTLMKKKTVNFDGTKLFMFMSVAENGYVCISTVSENALEILAADCGPSERKIQEWNAVN